MIVNALLIVLTVVALGGVGALCLTWRQWPSSNGATIFFVGAAVASVFIAWLSLFVAISPMVRGILGLGLLVLIWGVFKKQKQVIWASWQTWLKGLSWVDYLFIGLSFVMVAFASSAEIGLYDTGLYHTQNIKWIQEYAVVPGLGNLHGRFAFNSHFFLPSALFAFSFDKGGETVLSYPLNAAGVWVMLLQLYFWMRQAWRAQQAKWAITYLVLLSLCMLLYPSWVNAPTPDIFTALLVMQVLLLLLRGEIASTPILTVLIAVAITFKLSNVFLLFALVPFFIKMQHQQERRYQFVQVILIGVVVAIPFLVRNVVLSGYMVYPFAQLDVFDFDWKVPSQMVIDEKAHIASWAKVPRMAVETISQMPMSEWLPMWWMKKSMPFKLVLGLNALSFVALFFQRGEDKKRWLSVMMIIWLNLIFWFLNAPDPRFVHGFLLVNAAMGLATFGQIIGATSFFKKTRNIVPFAISGLLVVGVFTVLTPMKKMVQENSWLAATFPQPKALVSRTVPFLYVFPVDNNRCFDADLPCLPEENDQVEMRGNTLRKGFKRK